LNNGLSVNNVVLGGGCGMREEKKAMRGPPKKLMEHSPSGNRPTATYGTHAPETNGALFFGTFQFNTSSSHLSFRVYN
jgi:hypothetical protein